MGLPNYNPNIPLVTDPFSDWQVNFIKNFRQLYDAFSVNHVALDAAADAGNHMIIQMPEQESSVQTNVADISVYTKDVEGQTDQIFIKYGNGIEYQFTNYQIYSLDAIKKGSTLLQTQYFTFLPGKLLIYFGDITLDANGVIQLNPPVARNVVTVNLTAKDSTNSQGTPGVFVGGEDGFVTKVVLQYKQATQLKIFYVVVANI